jgi:hypothetical protein
MDGDDALEASVCINERNNDGLQTYGISIHSSTGRSHCQML